MKIDIIWNIEYNLDHWVEHVFVNSICVEIIKSHTNLAHIHMCGGFVTFAFNKEIALICSAHLLHIWKGDVVMLNKGA